MTKFVTSLCGILMVVFATAAFPAESASVDMGKRLFNDPQLSQSSNDRSCATCHANGAKLEHANRNPDLAGQVNRCIAGALGGKPLAKDSAELRSLVMYVQSLSQDSAAD